MPTNPTTGMLMTVLDALSRAQMNLKYQNAFLKRIFWDFQPIVAVPYSTLNVNVPTVNEANVVNIGAGPLQPNPYSFTTVPITLSFNQSNAYIVYDWDQTRVAYDLEQFFFQPKLEELMRSINRLIVNLFTAANFPTYPLFTGTGTNPGQVMRGDITKAWGNLATTGVPLEDYDNVSLMVQTKTYGRDAGGSAVHLSVHRRRQRGGGDPAAGAAADHLRRRYLLRPAAGALQRRA